MNKIYVYIYVRITVTVARCCEAISRAARLFNAKNVIALSGAEIFVPVDEERFALSNTFYVTIRPYGSRFVYTKTRRQQRRVNPRVLHAERCCGGTVFDVLLFHCVTHCSRLVFADKI